LVKVNRDYLPMLARPSLTDQTLTVIAIARAGELLQFLESTEMIELVNPLGSGADSSGTWYKARMLGIGEGWLFAKPNTHAGPPLAIYMTGPKKAAPQQSNDEAIILLVIFVLVGTPVLVLIVRYLTNAAPVVSPVPSPSASRGDSHYYSSSGTSSHNDVESPAPKRTERPSPETYRGTPSWQDEITTCPDCYGRRFSFGIEGLGDGVCSACKGRGVGDYVDELINRSLAGKPIKCRECGGSGRCSTCRGAGKI
jgi:hypothetical protein